MTKYHGQKAVALSNRSFTTVLLLVLFCLDAESTTTTRDVNGDSCFPAELVLSSLNGTNGFAIHGEADGDESGSSVSYAGDVNGDGVADIVIGAFQASDQEGESFVVFGKNTTESSGFPSEIKLSTLDGTIGFAAIPLQLDNVNAYSGYSVSYAGDVNGDSIDDIIIGAFYADPNGKEWAGTSYVVFGKNTAESASFPSELDLSSLDGTNGFAINGEAADDESGYSVSYAGDVNGDNIDDIIIGARHASPNGKTEVGTTYVVFGRDTSKSTSFPSELELSSLDGTNGFAINGEAADDESGYSVSYAGDVNGDNIDDVIIGAVSADPNGLSSGTSYVVFGRNTSESTSFPSELELSSLDGTNGFAINGAAQGDNSGTSVSYAGDVNGDNIDDITIGAWGADPNGKEYAGTSYVVFGKNTAKSTSFPPELELSSLDGTNGFAINGEAADDASGWSVSYAGDVNGDAIDDIIIGAWGADPNGLNKAGKSYVVFGKNTAESTSFPSEFNLTSLDGTNGFAINGEADGDQSGYSVSYAGDVNGDNIDDVVIGSRYADPNGIDRAGISYIIFGIDCTPDRNPATSMPTPVPTPTQPTRSPANEPAAQTAILSLLFQTPFVKATHDTQAFKDAMCEVVSTVTGLQCGENLEVLSVQGTTSSEGEEALLLSFEIPKGSIDVDNLGDLAAEINSELPSSDNEGVQNLPPIDEISYDDDGSSSSSLSTEAIVGIAIGSVFAMAALFVVGYKTQNRQHPTSAKKGFLGRSKHRNYVRDTLKKCSRGLSSVLNTVPKMKLSTYPPSGNDKAGSYGYDVFLTHDWGEDGANHERVSRINRALLEHDVETWFDEQRLQGDIKYKIADGIENSRHVIVFLTKRYMEKVNQTDNRNDYCRLEFNYAVEKRPHNTHIVVMEPEMCKTRNWNGVIGLNFPAHLYTEFCDDSKLPEVVGEILKKIGFQN